MSTKISKEEYKEAKGCLKRYSYNCINIMNIRNDIMSIGSQTIDSLPKAPYKISDNVLKSVIKLQEDEFLQKSIKEYNAVVQAIELLKNEDCRYIFENYYMKSKTKWEIIQKGMSERTFERRNQDLIYAVHNELKKWRKSGGKLLKKHVKMFVVKKSQVEILSPMRQIRFHINNPRVDAKSQLF